MKSFQKGGGTALSANWDEVEKAPVPIKAPSGSEAIKFEKSKFHFVSYGFGHFFVGSSVAHLAAITTRADYMHVTL